MPVYEYFCKSCDDKFEVRQSMGKMVAEMDCPEGHMGARKVLSVFAMVGASKSEAFESASCSPMGCGAENCCSVNEN